jgi:hypothetical protein
VLDDVDRNQRKARLGEREPQIRFNGRFWREAAIRPDTHFSEGPEAEMVAPALRPLLG